MKPVPILLALLLLLPGCAENFLYYPQREIVVTPASLGLAYDEVNLTASDGVSINAWWVPAAPARGAVIYCHGNGGNISYCLDTVRTFHDLGLSVLLFDYRGYGKSGGSPSEEGTYRDAEAAWRHVTAARAVAPERIVIFGRSLGGAIAAELAARHRPGALVLESTFTRALDVALAHGYGVAARLVLGDTYPTVAHLARNRAPLLVIHSPDDELIPYALGRRLYEAGRPPKDFLAIQGSHNAGFMVSAAPYRRGLAAFFARHLP